MAQSPCFFTPLAKPLLSPFFVPFTYLETLLLVTGSFHLGLRSQVTRKLTSPSSTLSHSLLTPNSQYPG